MRTIDGIREIVPKIRLYLHAAGSGIARFKLASTKHTQHTRIVFSDENGMDTVMIMFKQGKRPTPEEVEEVKSIFFTPEEVPHCEVMPHPDNDLIMVIYRMQEEDDDGVQSS